MLRLFIAFLAACMLTACGGGSSPTPTHTSTPGSPSGGGGSGSGGTPAVTNYATVTFDAGPAALATGSAPYTAFNEPYVSVTICAPGSTSNCQTIEHVILDTGSVGLRIISSVIKPSLMSALPIEKDASGNGVGECYQYVNSYAFGSVRQADFAIAGEKVSDMPFQVIGDTGAYTTIPGHCSAGGGDAITSVGSFGANGIIGVGTTTTDCGIYCQSGGYSGASYYDCPDSGCSTMIARSASSSAPFQQLPNPVAAFATDNNGTILDFPAVGASGVVSLTGTVYFGIGTQANNKLGSETVLPISANGGFLTAAYKGKALTQSFLDSGSNFYYFIDADLPICTQSGLSVLYCPTAPTPISPTLTATNGTTASGAFTLYNPSTTTSASANVAPGLGVNPTLVKPPLPFANSFDFGVPFFFGKRVYTAIEGRSAGGITGPYFAF